MAWVATIRWPASSNSNPVSKWSDVLRRMVRWDHWSSDFCRTASNSSRSIIGGCSPGRILILVFDLSEIEVIAQHIVQRATAERDPAARRTRGELLGSGSDVAFFEVP